MNKAERLAAAKRAMDEVDEGNPSLICQEIASEFGLSYEDVSDLYWKPLQESYNRRTQKIGNCHYCGGPAIKFNIFDVPVCGDCG